MINYINGDLFDSKADVLAHGVNCKGAFGSGVAKIMTTKYPKARFYYLDKYDEDGWKLGDVQFVTQWNGKIIANCATQDDYGYAGAPNADYEAIRKCMEKVKEFAKENGHTVAMPKIGAGLAGGDWNRIEGILNEVFDDYDVSVYYL